MAKQAGGGATKYSQRIGTAARSTGPSKPAPKASPAAKPVAGKSMVGNIARPKAMPVKAPVSSASRPSLASKTAGPNYGAAARGAANAIGTARGNVLAGIKGAKDLVGAAASPFTKPGGLIGAGGQIQNTMDNQERIRKALAKSR